MQINNEKSESITVKNHRAQKHLHKTNPRVSNLESIISFGFNGLESSADFIFTRKNEISDLCASTFVDLPL